jgi:DNA-binding transcriptional LysR family regulator
MAPADLAAHQAVIHTLRGGGTSWSFRRDTTEVAVTVSGRMRVNAAEGVRAAVLSDMGLAIASEWMFPDELASGAVRTVLDDWTLPPVGLWAVFPSGRIVNAKVRAFIAFVEATLNQPAPQD